MIKEVKYNGYSASPSDYECADGDLAMSLNAINEDGSLRPILPPKFIMMTTAPSEVVKCVHKTSNYIHYILVKDGNILRYKKDNFYYLIFTFPADIEIYQITPVGNTLVVLTSDGMYYFLWKEDKYISLGNELPELNVRPYISTNLMNTTSFALSFGITEMAEVNIGLSGDEYIGTDICKKMYNNQIPPYSLYGTVKQNVYGRVFAIINHYTTLLKRRGFFTEPFFVRFAYRMYDGSHVRHTVPVLLVPTTLGKPLMGVHIKSDGNAIFNPVYSVSQLSASIVMPSDMEQWYDIITDIDVFVSEPLVDYTDDADSLISLSPLSHIYDNENKPKCMTYLDGKSQWIELSSMIEELNNKQFYIMPDGAAQFIDGVYRVDLRPEYTAHNGAYFAFDTSAYKMKPKLYNISGQEIAQAVSLDIPNAENYTIFKISHAFNDAYGVIFQLENMELSGRLPTFIIHFDSEIASQHFIDTKRADGMNYNEVLVSCNTFYHVSEINVREIKDGLYNNLYDKPIPIKEGVLLSMTTRQTLSNLGQMHNRTISKHSFNYNNRLNVILEKEQVGNACTSLKKQNPSSMKVGSLEEILMACVEIEENGQKIFVEIPTSDGTVCIKDLLSFSFPHNNAKYLWLYDFRPNLGFYKRSISLKQHEFLNLSYAFNMFAPLNFASSEQITESDFVIPSNDTIEYGNIIRLSDVNNPFRFSEEYTVSLPVSKIYALSTAAKALSQGQFGQYPLYAFTSEGIWALEITSTGTYSARQPISRDVVISQDCITQIDNSVLFSTDRGIMLISGSQVICISDKINTMDLFTLAELPKSDKLVNIYNGIGASIASIGDVILLPFNEFLAECRMLYDYSHQRIIVYNPNVKYAYVYSLKSQQWGMMLSNITYGINSYPETLAAEGSRIVDFSKIGGNKSAVMIITRPLDMEHIDVFKTVREIIQRGNMKDAATNQVLYGSNDLNNWFVVWSSDNRRMGGFCGSPWKYYRIVVIREFDKSESIYGFSVQYDIRLTNRLR